MATKTVRKMTVKAVLTVASEVMDAGIKAPINVGFSTLGVRAFFNGKVLMSAVRTDIL